MPRSLADGHLKWTILTTKPVNPAAPTAAELNAGIDASCNVMKSDFAWGATDSDKVAEGALCEVANSNSLGASNYAAGVTVFRYYAVDGTSDADGEDKAYQAMKTKGTTLWGYARETGKFSTDPWAANDEIYLGAEFITDQPQPPSDRGGFQKRRIPLEIQRGYEQIEVAAGA